MSHTAPVACAQRRKQSLLDMGVALLIVVMAWPFPVMRALLSPAGHGAAMLVAWALTTLLYFGISAAVWQRTLGMRAFGLRLSGMEGGAPARGAGARWGIIAGATVLWYAIAPASACGSGMPERVSKTAIVSAGAAGEATSPQGIGTDPPDPITGDPHDVTRTDGREHD